MKLIKKQTNWKYQWDVNNKKINDNIKADGIITSRSDLSGMNGRYGYDDEHHGGQQGGEGSTGLNDTTATPPSTPTRVNFVDIGAAEDEKYASRTPQIAADLYKR